MKNKKIYISLLLIAFFSSYCLLLDASQQTIKKELLKWKQFTAKGSVELNYQEYTLRKDFVLNKQENKMRLDVYDYGLFSATTDAFISVYVDSTAYLKSPILGPEVMSIEQLSKDLPPVNDIMNLFGIDTLLVHADSIASKHTWSDEGSQYRWDKKDHLSSVENDRYHVRILFDYTNKGDLRKVEVWYKKALFMKLLVDTIKYTKAEITPLIQDIKK